MGGECGDGLREYLDWRPYEYFTCHLSPIEAEGVEFFMTLARLSVKLT